MVHAETTASILRVSLGTAGLAETLSVLSTEESPWAKNRYFDCWQRLLSMALNFGGCESQLSGFGYQVCDHLPCSSISWCDYEVD